MDRDRLTTISYTCTRKLILKYFADYNNKTWMKLQTRVVGQSNESNSTMCRGHVSRVWLFHKHRYNHPKVHV